jgi:iron complex transport system permease protein
MKIEASLVQANPLKITKKQSLIIIGLFFLVLISLFIGFLIGSFNSSFLNFISGKASTLENNVLLQIRFPRVILAGLVGASLGISGASLQGLFRNPLADPGLIGVSAGAALGASIVIVLGSI